MHILSSEHSGSFKAGVGTYSRFRGSHFMPSISHLKESMIIMTIFKRLLLDFSEKVPNCGLFHFAILGNNIYVSTFQRQHLPLSIHNV